MPNKRKITRAMIDSVAGLPSRKAAEMLGVGKTQINVARQQLRDGTLPGQFNVPGGFSLDISGTNVPQTAEEIDAALEVRGIDKGRYDVSYGFSEWDTGDKVARSVRVSAVPSRKQPAETLNIDPAGLLSDLRRFSFIAGKPQGGDGAFVFCLNDTQFGKAEGGGTPATLERLANGINKSIARIKELRASGRQIGTLVILGIGDIVEGCNIYPNQQFQVDLDRRGQINTAVTSILEVIDQLSPLFEKVIVVAAPGNHGQHRQNGNRVNDRDNDDLMVFEMAQRATERDDKLKHVEYRIADDEAGMTVQVAGWTIGAVHGDVFGRGNGPYHKAQNWYKNMAAGRKPMGQADVLVSAHWHHSQSADFGAWEWHQAPALDGGSKWFEDTYGTYSDPGVLTFVVTPSTRYQDELVIR